MEMLEHVPDPSSVINACSEMIKPGGSIYFSTINRNPKAFLFAIVGAEYVMNMLPRGTHQFAKFIRPSELDIWARACGLEVNCIEGVIYNPVTGMFRTSHDVDVNYMVRYTRPK
jgi:2-polyprenyl-6-hydroxyphenyl methylase/3-demethylubiquinone-9 3-methyltransferase